MMVKGESIRRRDRSFAEKRGRRGEDGGIGECDGARHWIS